MSCLSTLRLLAMTLVIAGPLSDARETSVYREDHSPRIVPQGVSFEPKSAVHGIAADGCEFSSQGFASSDGVGVSLQIKYCKSQANADKVFRKLAKSATKIFETTILTGKNGRRTGQRMVVAFSDSGLIFRREKIVWTKGDEVYILESSSFEHALLFEKRWRAGLV